MHHVSDNHRSIECVHVLPPVAGSVGTAGADGLGGLGTHAAPSLPLRGPAATKATDEANNKNDFACILPPIFFASEVN
jgi:hypothetical protein